MTTKLLQLLKLFIDICLFRKGPQDVPVSLWLMYATIAASILVSTLANWLLWKPGQPFGGFLLTLAILLWMVIGLLYWRGKMARLKQTFAALFGTDAVITAISLPITLYPLPQPEQTATGTDLLIAFVQLGVLAWSLLVIAHILRHALELPLHITAVISACWFLAAVMVYGLLSGAPAG